MNDPFKQADPQEPIIDPDKNYLEELVGENKKFKDHEALAKGKYHSDQLIELQKKQNEAKDEYIKQLREDNMKKASMEDLIAQLRDTSSNTEPLVKDEKPTITETDIEKMIEAKMLRSKAAEKQATNLDTVYNKLKETWGDNYPSILNKQISDLGLTTEDARLLAERSPQAFFRTLGLDREAPRETFQSPMQSRERRDNFAPTGSKKRTWQYYQDMYKKNPQLYTDRKIAVQMQQDAIELGEAFRDGDYYVKGLHEE